MSDVDYDLLLFAGEASEDEDNIPTKISQETSGTTDLRASGKTKKKKSKATTQHHNDSEEEGEASSGDSSPNSLQSAPMEDSDSESDVAPEFVEDIDKYPIEGKFIDSADRIKIMAMPEIEREQILADRATEVERERQSRLMKQILKSREADLKKSDKKRKASSTVDVEGDNRKGSRQRTKLGGGKFGETSSGINNLKRARAEKTDRQRRRDEDKDRSKDGRPYSDSENERDNRNSEAEEDEGRSRNKRSISPIYRDTKPADLHDVEKVRVGRSRFAMVCFYPGFEEAITGCYARISIGVDKSNGQNIYRMALIKGFVEDKPYAMETPNGKKFKTTQYIRAAHGTAERNWPFITCSDSAFTEVEWSRYEKTCRSENVPLPTKSKVTAKIDDINNLVNRSWTEAELQEKLKKSGALVNKFIPIERNRLNNLIKEAKSCNDDEKVARLQRELEELDGPKLAYNTSTKASLRKPAGLSQQERLAVLNRENRRKNAEQVRQAQINERRAAKIAEAALARGESINEDHSRRVKTRAKLKHDVSDSLSSKKEEIKEEFRSSLSSPNLAPKNGSTSVPYLARLAAEKKSGIPTVRRPLMDDDIIGAIDLGIDLDL